MKEGEAVDFMFNNHGSMIKHDRTGDVYHYDGTSYFRNGTALLQLEFNGDEGYSIIEIEDEVVKLDIKEFNSAPCCLKCKSDEFDWKFVEAASGTRVIGGGKFSYEEHVELSCKRCKYTITMQPADRE